MERIVKRKKPLKKVRIHLMKNPAQASVVGIRMSKSVDYVASILGCWYAGRPFVPLCPSLPPERVDQYASDLVWQDLFEIEKF